MTDEEFVRFMHSGAKAVNQFQTELLSPLILGLLDKVEKRMSGCHPVFKTTEQALMELMERLCVVESKLKEDWERIYKRDEAFGKRICELETKLKNLGHSQAEILSEHINRIEKLESENLMRQDTIACVDRAYDEATVNAENRLNKLEKINQDIVETLKDLGNFDVRWKKYLTKFERKKCDYCHATGKIVEEDLSPAAQGEGERYRMTVCPVCRGQRYA